MMTVWLKLSIQRIQTASVKIKKRFVDICIRKYLKYLRYFFKDRITDHCHALYLLFFCPYLH